MHFFYSSPSVQANHLKSELFSDDFYTRLQQKTRDIQSRARSTGAALARAKSSLKSMKQKLSTRAASSHHRLQQANSTLASMNLAAAVEEMMSQMHRAVTDGIADAQGGKAISKQKMNTSTTARNNNSTAKRTKNVTFLSH